jgi:hypothetical protein
VTDSTAQARNTARSTITVTGDKRCANARGHHACVEQRPEDSAARRELSEHWFRLWWAVSATRTAAR